MSVVGRKNEIDLLRKALFSSKSELIAVYGRRRVGKTFLIDQVYKQDFFFEITGLHNGSYADQLEHFFNVLQTHWKGAKKFKVPDSWFSAFEQLMAFINSSKSSKKKVIFIDEFPWMDTPRSKFLMAFENFWNAYAAKRKDLVVVICGSAAAYMVKNVVKNKGGLHNRITEHIKLLPFNLHETEVFLKNKGINLTRYDVLQLYMVMGGVPHYLDKVQRGESVAKIVDRLCFSQSGALHNEFENIFESLFSQHEKHIAIIKALASRKKGLTRSDLVKISGMPSGGTFTKVLNELLESGFIGQFLPYKKKLKDALFRLTDEYSLFYLKFMQNKKRQGEGTWLSLYKSQSYAAWSGLSFESICVKHIPQLKNALGIAAIYSENASWLGKNAQIDLLFDRADNVVTVCEMKFYNKPFSITKKYSEELQYKLRAFDDEMLATRKKLYLCMVTANGLSQNQYALSMVTNHIDVDSLFKF